MVGQTFAKSNMQRHSAPHTQKGVVNRFADAIDANQAGSLGYIQQRRIQVAGWGGRERDTERVCACVGVSTEMDWVEEVFIKKPPPIHIRVNHLRAAGKRHVTRRPPFALWPAQPKGGVRGRGQRCDERCPVRHTDTAPVRCPRLLESGACAHVQAQARLPSPPPAAPPSPPHPTPPHPTPPPHTFSRMNLPSLYFCDSS